MAEETRDVDVALRLTKEGDTGVFQETAADIEGLAQPVSSATELFDRFFALLKSGGGAGEDLERIQAAMQRVAEAADRFGAAKGIEEQREAIGELEAAWVAFGKEFESQIGSNVDTAQMFADALAEIRHQGEELGDPIKASLSAAERALEQVEQKAQGSFRGFSSAAGNAKAAIDQLRDEIRRAEAEGRDIGDAPRESLKRLEDGLDSATRKAATFKNAQEDVADAVKATRAQTDLGRGSINDLGDIFERINPKLADFVGKGFAVAGALTAGYAAGTKLREGLNWMTDGGFDRSIQGFVTRIFNLEDGLDDAGAAALRLQNNQNILRKNGIDPTGLSAEEAAAKVAELARKKYDAAQASEALAKSAGLSRKELDEESKTLVKGIEAFAAANKQLTQQDLGKIFGKQIQELLDHYAELKQEAPPAIRQIANAWSITTSEVESQAKRQEAAAKQLVESITGAVSKLGDTLPEQLAVLQKAFEKIDFSKLDYGSEGWQRAKDFLQQYVTALLAAGKQVPESVAAQSQSFGVLVPAMNVVADGASRVGLSINEATKAASANKLVFDPLTGTWTNVANAAKAAGDNVGPAADKIKAASDGVGDKKASLQAFNDEIARIKSGHDAAGKAAEEGAKKVVDGAGKIGEAKTGLSDAGAAAGEAATGLGKIGTEAKKLDGEAATAAKTGADKIKTELGTIPASVDPVVTALAGIETAFGKLNALKLDGLKAELDSVIAKANAAKVAIDAIDNAGAGAPN